jgi:D-aminopeptidase
MVCYEFKGGTGTASRRVDTGSGSHVVGALVQANHGIRDWLTILGVPVGRHLCDDKLLDREQGSIIVIVGTDIPMLPHQLRRLAKRASLGIARNGTPGGNSSGDIFLAFSVANPFPRKCLQDAELTMRFTSDDRFDPIYLAAVEAIEEATVNTLVAAEDMATFKPRGRICRAIDHAALKAVMARYGRLTE